MPKTELETIQANVARWRKDHPKGQQDGRLDARSTKPNHTLPKFRKLVEYETAQGKVWLVVSGETK